MNTWLYLPCWRAVRKLMYDSTRFSCVNQSDSPADLMNSYFLASQSEMRGFMSRFADPTLTASSFEGRMRQVWLKDLLSAPLGCEVISFQAILGQAHDQCTPNCVLRSLS